MFRISLLCMYQRSTRKCFICQGVMIDSGSAVGAHTCQIQYNLSNLVYLTWHLAHDDVLCFL